jgi:hypothetical protein
MANVPPLEIETCHAHFPLSISPPLVERDKVSLCEFYVKLTSLIPWKKYASPN